MLQLVIRSAKRLALLLPGLAIVYLSIFNIFPILDDGLPFVVAIFATYLLAAYVLLPATIRIYRIFFPAKHLPYYAITRDGFASDPVNIGIVGTREELRAVMQAAGWFVTDKTTIRTSIRLILSTIYRWHYPNGPMSNLYLFGRKQDEAFQIPIDDGDTGSRHHVRFWAANYAEGEQLTVSSIDWQQRQAHLRSDRLLWVGAASRDIGVTFIRHNAQLTHLVDPDTNAERELIVKQLQDNALGELIHTVTLDDPYKLTNIRGLKGHIQADGKMAVVEITARTS